MIPKKVDKEVFCTKQNQHLFILSSVSESDLAILASAYIEPTYFKVLTDIKQLW